MKQEGLILFISYSFIIIIIIDLCLKPKFLMFLNKEIYHLHIFIFSLFLYFLSIFKDN